MEVRLAVTDGTGTGVAFGDREVLILVELRMVVLPLIREASDVVLVFEILAVDMDDPSTDVRLVERDKRAEASDGAFWGFDIVQCRKAGVVKGFEGYIKARPIHTIISLRIDLPHGFYQVIRRCPMVVGTLRNELFRIRVGLRKVTRRCTNRTLVPLPTCVNDASALGY
jgi:hypothetical protein